MGSKLLSYSEIPCGCGGRNWVSPSADFLTILLSCAYVTVNVLRTRSQKFKSALARKKFSINVGYVNTLAHQEQPCCSSWIATQNCPIQISKLTIRCKPRPWIEVKDDNRSLHPRKSNSLPQTLLTWEITFITKKKMRI